MLRIGMQELDSIPEITFWVSNVGVVALGILFYFFVQNRLVRYWLMLGKLSFHFIVLPIIFSGCRVAIVDEVFCRESWWLLIVVPPIQLLIGMLFFIIVLLVQRKR